MLPLRGRRNAVSQDAIDVVRAFRSETLADSIIQEEKRRIKQLIDGTRYATSPLTPSPLLTWDSTAKLAPPLGETDLIQSLVFLSMYTKSPI